MRHEPHEVQAARSWLGMTQAELAEAMDVTPMAVRHWEAGRRTCSGPAAVLLELLCEQARPPSPLRPRYRDLAPEDWESAATYASATLKVDGWYTELHGGPGGWELRSRSGQALVAGPEPLPWCCVLAERVDGTEWAVYDAPDDLSKRWVVWSAVSSRGAHLPRPAVLQLVRALQAAGLPAVLSTRVDDPREAWETHVVGDGWEGLVFRTADGQGFARMKARASEDYVAVRVEANPLSGVTIIVGALPRVSGRLEELVRCPVYGAQADTAIDHLGEVFEVSGLAITASGSVRNPRFECWRPDKTPEDCTTAPA